MKLSIYPHFATGRNGLVSAGILSLVVDAVVKEGSGSFAIADLRNQLRATDEDVRESLADLLARGSIAFKDPETDVSKVSSFSVLGVTANLWVEQGSLDLTPSREVRGHEDIEIDGSCYRVEIFEDPVEMDDEAEPGKGHVVNVWRIDDEGERLEHVVMGRPFGNVTQAWAFWDEYARFLGHRYPALSWAMALPRDRTRIVGDVAGTAIHQEVVFVSPSAFEAIRKAAELRETEISDGAFDFAENPCEDAMTLYKARDVVRVPLAGHDLPEPLAELLSSGSLHGEGQAIPGSLRAEAEAESDSEASDEGPTQAEIDVREEERSAGEGE